MSLASTDNKVTYSGNGATTTWPFPFPVLEKAHIQVILTTPAGAETQLTSDYFVDLTGKEVRYPGYESGQEPPEADQAPVLPVGWKITLLRHLPLTQESDFSGWPFQEIEDALDRATMQIQQVAEVAGRAITIPVTGGADVDVPTLFGDLADKAVDAAMEGANGGHLYLQKLATGELKMVEDADWVKALPLPLAAPTAADVGKVIALASNGESFEYKNAISTTTLFKSIMWATPGTYTWTVPAGVTQLVLYGGGGGGGGNSNFGLAGGGAECALGTVLAVTPGETITIVVGAGGAGAAAGYTAQGGTPIPGGDGENTTISGSFGTITLHGGYGGGKDGKFDPGALGGPGGETGGLPAQYNTIDGYMQRMGGIGGNSLFGNGGLPGMYSNNPSWATKRDGRPGIGFSSGGGGGDHVFNGTTLSTAGGSGAKGFICLTYLEPAA